MQLCIMIISQSSSRSFGFLFFGGLRFVLSSLMFMKKHSLTKILNQVPVNYYERGVQKNLLQRIWHSRKYKILVEFIDKDIKNILDVGCASGHVSSRIKHAFPNASVVGVDLYKKGIESAKVRHRDIDFVHADAKKLPFKDKSFDVILCTETLEHVTDPKLVLLEIKRVLQDDGSLIVSMDSGNFLFRTVWFVWTQFGPGKVWQGAHIQHFTGKILEKMIVDCGFVIEKKKEAMFGMAVFLKARKG